LLKDARCEMTTIAILEFLIITFLCFVIRTNHNKYKELSKKVKPKTIGDWYDEQ